MSYISLDLEIAVGRATKKVNKLDLLIYYLKIEKGIEPKAIREMTGLKSHQLSTRIDHVLNQIRKELKEIQGGETNVPKT